MIPPLNAAATLREAADRLEHEPPSSSDPLAGRELVTQERYPDGGGEPTEEREVPV
jgi:hypothetical protein